MTFGDFHGLGIRSFDLFDSCLGTSLARKKICHQLS